jgi:flagellin-like hook-associated protein FlgL
LSLNAINTTVLNNDYIDVLFAENSSGVNKALFQRFDAEFRGLIADPVEIFEAVGGRAELVTLSDGSIRAYESFEGGEPVGYRDFTVAHNHGFDLTSISSSSLSIAAVDRGLENLNVARSEVGAQMNRIESAMNTLQITKENSAAAKSRIVDADYAAETARLAKHQILQQASISVLAQANARPEMVLALLRDL